MHFSAEISSLWTTVYIATSRFLSLNEKETIACAFHAFEFLVIVKMAQSSVFSLNCLEIAVTMIKFV